MHVELTKLKELNQQGVVTAHNNGPTPDIVIQLFETKPAIWNAELLEHDVNGVTHYSIPTIFATEKNGEYIMDSDVKNTIKILRDFFYGCDALKIQAGAEFGGRFRNRPPLIFLWWD
jgi:hypothetical protein